MISGKVNKKAKCHAELVSASNKINPESSSGQGDKTDFLRDFWLHRLKKIAQIIGRLRVYRKWYYPYE